MIEIRDGAIGRKWWGRWDTDCYASLPPDREGWRSEIRWVNNDQVTSNRSRVTNLTWEVLESHCSGESGSDAWEVRPQSIGLHKGNEGRIGISEWSSCISILIQAHHDWSMLMTMLMLEDGLSSWFASCLPNHHSILPILLLPLFLHYRNTHPQYESSHSINITPFFILFCKLTHSYSMRLA